MKKEKKETAKVTEKALYISLFAMVLSCAMLLESTYAWFTQTISTPVSVIQTGNMSAKLVIPTGEPGVYVTAGEDAQTDKNNLVFKEHDIVNKTGSGSTILEPGKKYCLPEIHVQNTGNIDLSYTITLAHDPSVTGDAVKLYEVLDFVVYVQNDTYDEWDWEHPIPLTVVRETQEAEASAAEEATQETKTNAEEEATQTSEVDAIPTATGVLKAPEGEETAVSKGFVIQATMKEDAGIEYAGLELSGLQIIVNATQVIPENE